MINKFLNNKIILIISILFSANINNINCGDDKEQIELQKDSFITINGYKLDISGAKFTEEEINKNFDKEEKIINFIFEKFGDKVINLPKSNTRKLKNLCEITNLIIFPWNSGNSYKFFNDSKQKEKLFEAFWKNIKKDKKMNITLKNKPSITVKKIDYKYYMKKEIKEAFTEINNKIKKYNYVTLDIIKKLNPKNKLSKKSIDDNDIVVYKNKNKKYKDTEIIKTPDNSIIITLSNFEKYYNKISATIEYVIPENLELEENIIKTVDSIEDNFQSDDIYIHKFFKKKYGLEHNKNCVLEGFSYSQNKYVKIDKEDACFFLGTKIKITINEEIPRVTKKKTKIDKPVKDKININLKFEVKDSSKYVFKTPISTISNLEIEKDNTYNDLILIINDKLGDRELKEGFKIYKNDRNNEFTDGILEDNITYIVVFDENATDFVDKKDPKNPPKTQETTTTEQNSNNYETTKKGGCSGKNGKCSNKK